MELSTDDVLRRIVRAIVKAVTEDIPEYLQEQGKETNNAVIHLRGDYINDNLRAIVINENIEFVPFRRYTWSGRLLADRGNKRSYSITTQNNLMAIPRKHRNSPHFLQSVLFMENGGLEATIKQMCLYDMEPFQPDALEEDYNSIVEGMLNPSEGYHHYVISYEASGNEVRDIRLDLLDKDFGVVETRSLNEFIKPDIIHLTDAIVSEETVESKDEDTAKGLLRVKEGLRPKLRDIPEQI